MGKVVFSFLFLFCLISQANAEILKPQFRFLHDKADSLSFQSVKEMQFKEINFGGFYSGSVWAKTNVCPNNRGEGQYLIYKDPIEQISVFTANSNTPLSYSFLDTTDLAPHFWVKIPVTVTKCTDVYVKFKSGDVLNFEAELLTDTQLNSAEVKSLFFYALYYAFFLIVFGLSLFFFIKTRKIHYALFCSIIVFQDLLGASLLNGYLFRFIVSPSNFVLYDLGNIFAPLMNASLVLFAFFFLPKQNKFINAASIVFSISQIAIALTLLINVPFQFHSPNAQLSQFVNQSILFACFWTLFLSLCQIKSKRGQLFLFASSFKVGGQFFKTLLLQGDISGNSSFLIFNVAAIGSLFEAIAIIFFLVSSYFRELEDGKQKIVAANDELENAKIDIEIGRVSKQVAHDIKSPLTSLNLAISKLEEKNINSDIEIDLVKKSLERIQDIANNIDSTKASSIENIPLDRNEGDPKIRSQLASELLHQVISEKRFEFKMLKDIHIESRVAKGFEAEFIRIDSSKFYRLISNLVNNSVDAIQKSGNIIVSLAGRTEGHLKFTVTDTGHGMDESTLLNSTKSGYSNKKDDCNSSGLGLSYVKQAVSGMGGNFDIASKVGTGTTVTLALPSSAPPVWYCHGINVESGGTVVVLDDDPSIHQTWKTKFNSSRIQPHIVCLSNQIELSRWILNNPSTKATFLIDYQLSGSDYTGMQLIEHLDLSSSSILVTSNYGDLNLQTACVSKNVTMLPKPLIPPVTINILEPDSKIQSTLTF